MRGKIEMLVVLSMDEKPVSSFPVSSCALLSLFLKEL